MILVRFWSVAVCLAVLLEAATGMLQSNGQVFELFSKAVNSVQSDFEEFVGGEEVPPHSRYNDELCIKQLLQISNGVNDNKEWALRMIDSWGKIPSGLYSGNFFDFGMFDQCLDVSHASDDGNTIKGQYCLPSISAEFETFSDTLRPSAIDLAGRIPVPTVDIKFRTINIGVCVPLTCSPNQVGRLINRTLIDTNQTIKVNISEGLCNHKDQLPWRPIDFAAMAVFGVIGLLLASSTIYDLRMKRLGLEGKLVLRSFSIYTNGSKLFSINRSKSTDVIDCLHGIRVLSILWIVLGHTYMLILQSPVSNQAYMLKWVRNLFTIIVMLGPLSVDSFFLLSGFLLAVSFLKKLEKNSGKINIWMMYLHRYLRLTPVVAAFILFTVSLMRHMGSGPLWNTYIDVADKLCVNNWWSTLLYVQNYVHPDSMCLGHTWYLAVDMQLFVLSPIILYPLWKWGKKVVPFIVLLITGSIVYIFVTFYANDFINQYISNPSNPQNQDRMRATYSSTHARMAPWLIGVILGYIVHSLRNKEVKIRAKYNTIGWFLSAATFVAISGGMYFTQQVEDNVTVLECAFYDSLCHTAWALAVSWVIFSCMYGYGGVVNWLCSLTFWQPLAKISYSIYIVHLPLQLMLSAAIRRPYYFADVEGLHRFFGDIVLAILLSIVWTLAFENPIFILENIIFGKKDNKEASRENLVNSNSGLLTNPISHNARV